MTKIMATAESPEEAIRKAGMIDDPLASSLATGERPVMIQVPDSSMACFY
jgi:hypothetical protein